MAEALERDDELDFDTAFADALDVAPAKDAAPVDDVVDEVTDDATDDAEITDDEKASDDADELSADEAPSDDAEADADADAADEVDDAEKSAEEVEAKKADAEDDDILDRLADLVRKSDPEKSPLPVAKPAEKPAEAAAEEEAPIYSTDEQKVIDAYKNDYPEVANAENLIRRSEYQQIVKYVFEQVSAGLAPVLEQVDVLATKAHLGDLHAAVEDYDDVREPVLAWVDEQPEYLQEPFKRVISSGTPDEVQDLIQRWRASTGTTQKQSDKPVPAKENDDAELPEATKKAAASLAPVRSKRSVVPQSEDVDDFDGAFAKAAAS